MASYSDIEDAVNNCNKHIQEISSFSPEGLSDDIVTLSENWDTDNGKAMTSKIIRFYTPSLGLQMGSAITKFKGNKLAVRKMSDTMEV